MTLGDLSREHVPMALAELHWECAVGQQINITIGPGPDDDSDDETAAQWVLDVIEGGGFTAANPHVLAPWAGQTVTRRRSLPDVVGPGMRVLVCGLNPSEYAADTGVGFARPGNRFWPAVADVGLANSERDPRGALAEHGLGMTDLAKRATPRSSELTKDEYRAGLARVERLTRWLMPAVVCFVGLEGYRAAADRKAGAGWIADGLGGRPLYLMPSTSGLNARTTAADFRAHLETVIGASWTRSAPDKRARR
ncbi:MAG: mismatch-specific DNA-glycosylase [Acidimicrobiales bacterium]